MKGGICIIAGEASGDAQAAPVVRALRAELASLGLGEIPFWGAAGPRMRAEGVEPLVQSEELAVMAFAEIVPRFFRIKDVYHRFLFEMESRRPAAVVLVDYPGFNLRMAKDAFLRGQTVLYHIAPKVWAHGAGRVAHLAQHTHLTTCILPFEEQLLRAAGVNAHFVGNPLRDAVAAYRAGHPAPVGGERRVVALVPGSRRSEIERLLPILVQALFRLGKTLGAELEGLLPVAPTLDVEYVREVACRSAREAGIPLDWLEAHLTLVPDGMYAVLSRAEYAWVCSGTATLETAFFGVPMAVAYRMHLVSAIVGKCLLRIPWVSLANLCANRELVPEFLQYAATPENLVAHALSILKDPQAKEECGRALAALSESFPLGAATRTARLMADAILEYLLPEPEKFHRQAFRRGEVLKSSSAEVPWAG